MAQYYRDEETGGIIDAESGRDVTDAYNAHPLEANFWGAGDIAHNVAKRVLPDMSDWPGGEVLGQLGKPFSEEDRNYIDDVQKASPFQFGAGQVAATWANPTKSWVAGTIYDGIQGALTADDGEAMKGAVTAMGGGAAGRMVTTVLSKISNAVKSIGSPPPKTEGAKQWESTGTKGNPAPDLTPAQKSDIQTLTNYDKSMSTRAGSGDVFKEVFDAQKKHVNDLTLRAMGLDPANYTRISGNALDQVQTNYNKVVKPMFKSIPTQEVTGRAKRLMESKLLKGDTRALLEDISGFKYTPGSEGVESVLEMDGKAMFKLRQKLSRWTTSSDEIAADHAKTTLNALDDVIESNLGKSDMDAYARQRQNINVKMNLEKGATLSRGGDLNDATFWRKMGRKDINEDVQRLQDAVESTGMPGMQSVLGNSDTAIKQTGWDPKQMLLGGMQKKAAQQYLKGNMLPMGLLEEANPEFVQLGANIGRTGLLAATDE